MLGVLCLLRNIFPPPLKGGEGSSLLFRVSRELN